MTGEFLGVQRKRVNNELKAVSASRATAGVPSTVSKARGHPSTPYDDACEREDDQHGFSSFMRFGMRPFIRGFGFMPWEA